MAQFGTVISAALMLGPHAVEVSFLSSWSGHHQLYIGRKRAAVTSAKTDRTLIAQLEPGNTPAPIQVIAVEDSETASDFGSALPDRPYNLHRLHWSAAGIESDTDRFRITGATAVDTNPTEFLGAVQYVGGVNAYSFDTPALEASGNWRFGITPYDNTCGDYADDKGNAGTESIATINAKVCPPDVAVQSDRQRFNVSASGSTLTVSFDYQE